MEVIRASRLIQFGKDVVKGWLEADAFMLAAALAYSAIFAIAPLLLISIYLASLFFDRAAAVEDALELPSWTVAAVIAIGNFLLSVLIFTAIFKFVPSAEVTWRAAAAGGSHYIALSVVGSDRIRDSGYLRAKRVQEGLIEADGVPYTVLRATQFFEFLNAIADGGTKGNAVYMSPSQVPACRGGRRDDWVEGKLLA